MRFSYEAPFTMRCTKIPGVWIPDALVARMDKTPKPRQAEEGLRICVELIQQVREIAGVRGVHVMAYRQEEAVAEIIHRAGLLPRRASTPLPAAPLIDVPVPDMLA